jgi:cell division protein FtsL
MAKRRLGRRRGRLIFTFVLAGFVVTAVSIVWRRSIGISQSRTLRSLETERLQLEGERARLARDLQEATSRPRLGGIAERRLGMHVPADHQLVFLRRAGPDAR